MLQSVGGHPQQFGHNQRGARVFMGQEVGQAAGPPPEGKDEQQYNQPKQVHPAGVGDVDMGNPPGAGGILGQIRPPLQDGMKPDAQEGGVRSDRAAEDEDAAEDVVAAADDVEEQEEEVELNEPPLEPINQDNILDAAEDDDDETIRVDETEPDADARDQEYDRDDAYEDNEDDADAGGAANYIDTRNREDKYEDEHYELRGKGHRPNAAVEKPKGDARADNKVQRHVRDEQDYDQYLDQEEEVLGDNKQQHRLQMHRAAPDFVQHRFDGREPNDDADQGYNYYMNKDEPTDDVEDKDKSSKLGQEDRHSNVYPQRRRGGSQPENDTKRGVFPAAPNTNHIGKAYLLLLITMCGLMYLMYRFVKQRRVVIKYHHRTYHR